MVDVFTKEKRSDVMRKIRSVNSKPEIEFRKLMFREGFRYRLNVRTLPSKPDIVLKKYKTIILIHGCFWHGHNNCKLFRMPKSNKKYWIPKIKSNIDRDRRNLRKLKKLGWKVIIVRECKIKKDSQKCLINVISKIKTEK